MVEVDFGPDRVREAFEESDGQVAYDWTARTAVFTPSAALAGNTPYTATLTTGVRDAAGNALASAFVWTFRTAAANTPNITVALPGNGTAPVAIGAGLAAYRKTIGVTNIGTANLAVGKLALAGAVPSAFSIAFDACSSKALAPGATCSFQVQLAGDVSPIKTARVDIPSNDPDTPTAAVPLTTTTARTPAAYTYYFAEGATSALFDTFIALANPGTSPTSALLRFLKADGSTVTHTVDLPALGRRTVNVKALPGLATAEFSTVVESETTILADRTMYWDASVYGSHAETGIAEVGTTWYLAEGATHSGFNLFYLIQNPGATTASVTVTYLLSSGPPVAKTYAVPASSRFNIWVNNEAGALPPLANADVSAKITSDVPIIVERAMYLNAGGLAFGAGHESAGVTAPATSWFLAEGATGDYFDLFVLVANPSSQAAAVEARFLLTDGTVIAKTYDVAANSRFNIWVDQQDPRLRDAAVSTTITSTNNVPIIVERAMWWPGPTGATWFEAHNSPGSTKTGTQWGLAEGEVGGPRNTQTYILVANTSPVAGTVRVTLLFEDGTSAQQTFDVGANSRFNVDVGGRFLAAAGRVERAMYSDARGVTWAAGTNALATRLK